MSFNRRQILLGGGATIASPFVCRAYAESLAITEIILALDASGSMYELKTEGVKHWDIQVAGHLYALGQQEIIRRLVDGRVYLRIILWSDGRVYPEVFGAPIRSEQDVAFAWQSLQQYVPKCTEYSCSATNHYTAVEAALALPRQGYRRVLDISTDEETSTLYQSVLDPLRDSFSKQGGTINALAVGLTLKNVSDLQKNLCTPEGFCFQATDWQDYSRAIEGKIMAEIA